MQGRSIHRRAAVLVAMLALSACAGTETLVSSPTVSLSSVELERADFRRQTFLIGFDVSNPNPFPLPVRSMTYRVLFDDEKFAGGKAAGSFTVPARSEDEFQISVDLDILNSAGRLASFVQNGVPDEVNYALEGSLTVDIPFTRPIPFSSSGVINVGGYR
jgi:LEA14-like dessication related protein